MNPDYEHNREENDILIACALRFDGHKYVTTRNFNYGAALRTLEQTGDLGPFEQQQHLALFYMLQRFLYKWGGETLSRRSPQWRIFRELFFLCCQAEVPENYRLEPTYGEWERFYAPRLDECIALVRRTHNSIDYLPQQMLHPSLQRERASDNTPSVLDKLALSNDYPRRFEEQAMEVLRLFPEAAVERTRDVIQINVRDTRGIVLLLTPETLELRLPTVEWHGPHSPALSSSLWKRVKWGNMSRRRLQKLCDEALRAREELFKHCRFCGREFPPEHRHDDVCHGCAERELGVVH